MTQTEYILQLSHIADAVAIATGERLDIDDVEEVLRLQEIALELAIFPNDKRNKQILAELSRMTLDETETMAWPHGGAPLQYRDDVSSIGLDDPMLDDLNESLRSIGLADSTLISSNETQFSVPKFRVIEGSKNKQQIVIHSCPPTKFSSYVRLAPFKRSLDRIIIAANSLTLFAPDTIDIKFSNEELDANLNIGAWSAALTAAEYQLNTFKKRRFFHFLQLFNSYNPRYEINTFGENSKEMIAISGSLRTSMRYVVSGNNVFIKIHKSSQSNYIYSVKEKITLRDTPLLASWLAEQFEDDPEVGSGLVHSLNEHLSAQNS
ncbi:hypothetical protein [Pseudomonas syringae]|uniref:hypothetical protein n=1 Tax=Pseudomonas syringae TaxID=317 RepID=UPI00200AE8D7|nr:hypothetical protein [Pseudomonas syringae]MCK9744982.1 hypothetical protein [Pseudomonas syringae pv. syringae]MCK9767273.1 hypothetical protein [Pseudomonas syringae pv. syringae]